jgi:hypothetical protein
VGETGGGPIDSNDRTLEGKTKVRIKKSKKDEQCGWRAGRFGEGDLECWRSLNDICPTAGAATWVYDPHSYHFSHPDSSFAETFRQDDRHLLHVTRW